MSKTTDEQLEERCQGFRILYDGKRDEYYFCEGNKRKRIMVQRYDSDLNRTGECR